MNQVLTVLFALSLIVSGCSKTRGLPKNQYQLILPVISMPMMEITIIWLISKLIFHFSLTIKGKDGIIIQNGKERI